MRLAAAEHFGAGGAVFQIMVEALVGDELARAAGGFQARLHQAARVYRARQQKGPGANSRPFATRLGCSFECGGDAG